MAMDIELLRDQNSYMVHDEHSSNERFHDKVNASYSKAKSLKKIVSQEPAKL